MQLVSLNSKSKIHTCSKMLPFYFSIYMLLVITVLVLNDLLTATVALPPYPIAHVPNMLEYSFTNIFTIYQSQLAN